MVPCPPRTASLSHPTHIVPLVIFEYFDEPEPEPVFGPPIPSRPDSPDPVLREFWAAADLDLAALVSIPRSILRANGVMTFFPVSRTGIRRPTKNEFTTTRDQLRCRSSASTLPARRSTSYSHCKPAPSTFPGSKSRNHESSGAFHTRPNAQEHPKAKRASRPALLHVQTT